MNGRPNGIGGRAEGSGGRYGWLRHTCQLDLSYMCARTHASQGGKAACIPGAHTARPCKIYCNNGHINTRLLLFHFHRLFSRSSPHHMPHSVLLRPRAPFILLCTPAALHSRTHVRTSSKLISSKPPSWQVADAGHARHDTRDWGGHWHAHTHRHAHCAHGIAGHHWVEHHRVEHLVRDAWWANADEWWWSRE